MNSILGSLILVTLLAILLALGVMDLDPSNNPYDYRIPSYEDYYSPKRMAIFKFEEQSRVAKQKFWLSIKLLFVALLWVGTVILILNNGYTL